MSESKRMKKAHQLVQKHKVYAFDDAVKIAKEISANVKFDESLDVAVMLGVDPRKTEQVVRSATVLPNGTGKIVRVAVFAQGANADAAKAAGADIIGFEDLAEYIKTQSETGKLDFDVLIATPDAMRLVGQLGRILGPKNLMPNPKVGTVTTDVAKAVRNAKSGQVSYRTDKAGIIHCTIGKVKFDASALKENLNTLLADLRKAKPVSAKGIYVKKITIASTMGPGLIIDLSSLVVG